MNLHPFPVPVQPPLQHNHARYDEVLRLLTAQRGPDNNIQRKYQYDYDRYGNRWAQQVVAGSGLGGTNTFNTANNRVTTANFAYDGSGNLTAHGGGSSYTYNQENFMTAAASTTYVYDAQGRRVRKTAGATTTEYFYIGSEVMSEKQGSTWTDYIFFGGQRIAKQTGATSATATYPHVDHLRSTRVCTDSNGNSNGTCHFEPFGEIQPGSTCSVPTNYRFAGMEWDSDAQLYHTWFRQYDPNQARWMSVDPIAGDPSNLQSLNRYAYVGNDPVNRIDPLGLNWTCVEACVDLICDGKPCGRSCTRECTWLDGPLEAELPEMWWWVALLATWYDLRNLLGGQGPGGDAQDKIKKAILAALKNTDCAELLGGTESAGQLANRFNIFDVRTSAPPLYDRAEFAAWQFTSPNRAASTAPFSRTGNIYVNVTFWNVPTTLQAATVIHELRHQKYGFMGEPPWGTKAYKDFIKKEYATIQKNCFGKK